MEKFVLGYEERKYLGYYMCGDNHYKANHNNTQCTPKFYSIDCEFVLTDIGEELAKVAIYCVDINQEYVWNVKPNGNIIDWLEDITGMNENTKWDMNWVQSVEYFSTLINKQDILIGHHLSNDLAKLNFYHEKVIDTAIMFPTPDGLSTFYSLKQLAKMHLKKNIQSGTHCPLEDAKTTLELVQFSIAQGYNKVFWKRIGESIILDKSNIGEVLTDSLGTKPDEILCVYTRGSRAVGTSKYNSDYDLVVICDNSCKFIPGTLTCYANIDICVYCQTDFEEYLRLQYIWALECIYCPKKCVYLEKINYGILMEKCRLDEKPNEVAKLNNYLFMSVGYETGRKLASAKKHYTNKDYHQSKKHIFIAFRFMDLASQIVNISKIKSLSNCNFVWWALLSYNVNCDWEQFKSKWFGMYVNMSKQLSKQIKFKKIKKIFKANKLGSDIDFKLFNHVSFQRNFNFELLIIKLILSKQIDLFLIQCPQYITTHENIIRVWNEFKIKLNDIYTQISAELGINIGIKKDFAEVLNKYAKNIHKYLYLLRDGNNIELANLNFKPVKIYQDLGLKYSNKNYAKNSNVNININANFAQTTFKPIPKTEWVIYQIENASKVIKDCAFNLYDIRYVGGLDISFDKCDDAIGCAYLTIWDCVDNKIVWEDYEKCTFDIPYVSGFLGFREYDVYKRLIMKIDKKSNFYPQVLLVDGNGILHHNEFGSASHIGVGLDIPTIGVAKTLLYHDGLDEFIVKNKFKTNCKAKGDNIELIGKSGKSYGVALKTSDNATNPIYVSIGHKINIDIAIKIVLKTSLHKIPEPIRNSDIKSKLFL